MSRSNGHLALTAIFGSLISVLVAGLASAATDRLFLPIVGGLGDEPLSAVFLILPVGVTIVIGVVHRYGTSLIVGASLVAAASTVGFAWMVFIGWIAVVCGLQGNACFD
jgi:hypothetical protein